MLKVAAASPRSIHANARKGAAARQVLTGGVQNSSSRTAAAAMITDDLGAETSPGKQGSGIVLDTADTNPMEGSLPTEGAPETLPKAPASKKQKTGQKGSKKSVAAAAAAAAADSDAEENDDTAAASAEAAAFSTDEATQVGRTEKGPLHDVKPCFPAGACKAPTA